jgi:polysaccharide chain length determinant protein (PEP-CTERM system associated)
VLPGKTYTPDEIVRLILKHKWLLIVPFVLGVTASVLAAKRITPLYRSETLIMLVPQRIPDEYVKSPVTTKIEDRLQTLSDQILSRSRLERIITDFNLYPELRATGIMEDVVQRMRRDIHVNVDGKDSFRVDYVSTDPRTAQKVTERLGSWVIEENLRDRENLAESTNQFLESQLADAKRRLVEHEKKLEEYRRRYSGQLPSQLTANLQAINNAQLQLQAVSETINRASERRLLIERQIADAESLPAAAIPIEQTAAVASSDGPLPMTTAQQLEAAQSRLNAFRMRYTPDHPDVKALERTIAELQAKAAEEAKHPSAPAPKPMTPAEAARQKRIRDLQAELAVIDHQIAAGHDEEARLKARIGEYQGKVDVVPTRESELVELTRDYSTLQATYDSLLKKKEESKLAANLERNQIGEQFKIIDPASLPERAYNRKTRLMVLGGGSASGLILGVLMIAFLEYRDSSFRREEEIVKVLTLPVLALVPLMISEEELQTARRRKRVVAAGIVAMILVIGSAAMVIWRLQLLA